MTDWTKQEALDAMRKGPRTPLGCAHPCTECNGEQATGVEDLISFQTTPGGIVAVAGLTGTRCQDCGAETFDARSVYLIRTARQSLEAAPDYETTVTTVGKMPATYLKADLVRALHLEKGQRLRWRPLGKDRAEMTILPPE